MKIFSLLLEYLLCYNVIWDEHTQRSDNQTMLCIAASAINKHFDKYLFVFISLPPVVL